MVFLKDIDRKVRLKPDTTRVATEAGHYICVIYAIVISFVRYTS